MATLKELEKYLGYKFSFGPYTGSDYTTFQNKYINYLRSLCRQSGWELVNVGRNHYGFSAFIKNPNGRCVYFAISDVRYWQDAWYNHVLIRTAQHERDYRGGSNQYTSLPRLQTMVKGLFS